MNTPNHGVGRHAGDLKGRVIDGLGVAHTAQRELFSATTHEGGCAAAVEICRIVLRASLAEVGRLRAGRHRWISLRSSPKSLLGERFRLGLRFNVGCRGGTRPSGSFTTTLLQSSWPLTAAS